MTDREKNIEKEGLEYNWILKERGDVNYPDEITVNTFAEGAKWADNNPSEEAIDKMIKKVIYLLDKRGLTLGYYSIDEMFNEIKKYWDE